MHNETVLPAPRGPVQDPARRSALSSTAWIVPETLDLAEWLDYGRRFGALGRGVAWWIGDWLVCGNARYGERYSRAARITGYDPQSLMNMVYVASRFEHTRRRSHLSWSHHAEVAALNPSQQDHWLDIAQQQRMSVHSLRLEVRSARKVVREAACTPALGADALDGREREGQPESPRLICPRCRHIIEA